MKLKSCPQCKSNPCCCSLQNDTSIKNNPVFNFNPVINIPPVPNNGGQAGLLTEFDGSVAPPPINIPQLGPTPATIGTVSLTVDESTNRVLLQANIPWEFTETPPETVPIEVGVEFRILRNAGVIYSARDSVHGESPSLCGNSRITSIMFLDESPPTGTVTYTLDARGICAFGTLTPGLVTTAPATLTASEIKANS